jgi:ParB-like chromosome segregation protein Spo0J
MTTRQIIRKPVPGLKHGQNIRSDLGSEEELRRLGKSIRKWQRTPLLILPDGSTVVDGNRSLAAARLEGIEELDCVVIDATITPAEYKRIQWTAAVHRQDISAYDKAVTIRDIRADHPGMSNKQLADEVLDIDPATVTKNLTLFDCIPDVQEAAKAGKIGLSGWYEISKSPDQAAALAAALNGATRDELQTRSRRNGNGHAQPVVRLPRIKIPLATETATGTVTLAGDDIDLDDAETLLKEATKAVKAARDKNLDAKTAQAVWRDMAKAGA